jgi:hypothetical protein
MIILHINMSKVGGLKLKNALLVDFQPILNMMNKGQITLLTAASLKGFMFKLDVNKEDSEYFDLGAGGRFNSPVVSFILKFTLTAGNDDSLPRFEFVKSSGERTTIKKSCESNDSFFAEALLQQKIWETNILGGRQSICPSVANLALFQNASALQLLSWMSTLDLTNDEGQSRQVVNYLLTQLQKRVYGIGVITMPTIQGSSTLGSFCRTNPTQKDDAKISVVIQIMLLFLQNVIHLDLHMGNSLVFMKGEDIHTRIIDFGRAATFDEYSPLNFEKNELLKRMFALPGRLKSGVAAAQLESGQNIIRRILTTIADTEHRITQANYNIDDKSRYQMIWIEPDFIREGDDNLLLKVYNGLVESYKSKGTLSVTTIKKYKSQGILIDLDDIRRFIQPTDIMSGFEVPVANSDTESYVSSAVADSPSPNTSLTVVNPHVLPSFNPSAISGRPSLATPRMALQFSDEDDTISPITPLSEIHNFSELGGFSGGKRTRRKRRIKRTKKRR